MGQFIYGFGAGLRDGKGDGAEWCGDLPAGISDERLDRINLECLEGRFERLYSELIGLVEIDGDGRPAVAEACSVVKIPSGVEGFSEAGRSAEEHPAPIPGYRLEDPLAVFLLVLKQGLELIQRLTQRRCHQAVVGADESLPECLNSVGRARSGADCQGLDQFRKVFPAVLPHIRLVQAD